MAAKPQRIVVKVVTFILFGLLIISFGIWGIGDIFRGRGRVQSAAEVGDHKITEQEFSRTLSREINRLSNRLGQRLDAQQARAIGLPDQVLGQMISRALFDLKAADQGIVVTDAQVVARIQQEPAFQGSLGKFDRNLFLQTLRASGLSEQEYVDSLRRDMVRERLANAAISAVLAPETLAETLYRYREERRVARLVTVPNASVKEVSKPDEEALKAFHKEFSDRFMAPELRSITLVQLRASDLAKEVKVSEQDLRKEFELQKKDLAQPERRTIEQIVLPDEKKADEAAKRLEAGEDFATVAKDMTGNAPIDLGSLSRQDLPPELAKAAFALEAKKISPPVHTELGWHILHVTKIEPAKPAVFAEVRDKLAKQLAMRQAIDSIVSLANQLDDELASGATLEQAAAALDLPVRKIDAIDRKGNDANGDPVKDLPKSRFLEVAFDTQPGEDSLLIDTGDSNYFVLRVDGVTPAQVRPLDEVRDQVVALWQDSQRAKIARERAEALAKRARNGESLDTLASQDGYKETTTDPLRRFDSGGPSPTLVSKLFQLKTGELATVPGNDGHIVVQLEKVIPADPAAHPDDVAKLRDNLDGSMQNDMLDELIASLRKEYGVTVNQDVVDSVLASY